MENTGEVLTANVPTAISDIQSVPEVDMIEPISDAGMDIIEPEMYEQGLIEEESLETEEVAEIEEITPQEISDMEKIESVREMIQQEIENRVQTEIEEKGLVTKEEVANMLLLALLLLEQYKKEGQESLFEVFLGIITTLIRDMFEPEEMEKRRLENSNKTPKFGVNAENIKSLMDVFAIRQKNKSSILEMPSS